MGKTPTYEELQQWMWGHEQEDDQQRQPQLPSRTAAAGYRKLLDNAHDLIQSIGPDGSFRYVNHAWLATLGYSRQELNSLTLHDIIHPDHREHCTELFQRVLAGEPLPRLETTFLTKHGDPVAVEGSVNCRFARGKPVATCGIFRNITERKQAEAAMRRNEEQCRELLDNAYDLIHSVAPDGTLLYANPAWRETLGYSDEEIRGMSMLDIVDSSCHARCAEFFQCLLRGEAIDRNEATFVAKDGRRIEVEGRCRCKFENGRPVAILGIYRDITERKESERLLRESAEKVQRFAYSISHDLKSPAIALQGVTRLLHRRYGDAFDEKGQRYCQQVLNSAIQITELVEKINDFIAAKEMPMLVEEIPLAELCRAIEEEFHERFAARHVEWLTPVELPVINGDRLALMRVLRNLVDNAVKYGGDTLHTIEIGYRETPTTHVITVRNDGSKTDDADGDLFGRFQRSKSSRTIAGTGLGLAIVKELVARHGGEVRHQNGASKGTAFHVSIAKTLAAGGT